MMLSICGFDRAGDSMAGEGGNALGAVEVSLCSEVNAGEENVRFGAVLDGLGGGGKRNDFVDQVLMRWRGRSEPPFRRSPINEERSVVGVEGGVLAEANTSNWRERYVREFIPATLTAGQGSEGFNLEA